MVRRKHGVDGNDAEISKVLKNLGFEIINTTHVGGEMLDKIGVYHGIPVFIEIKDGRKLCSQRLFTEGEKKFLNKVMFLSAVVRDEDDCIKLRDMMEMVSDEIHGSRVEWRYMPEEYEDRL